MSSVDGEGGTGWALWAGVQGKWVNGLESRVVKWVNGLESRVS